MYSPIARSVVLRRNQTILKLLGNISIHIAARSRLSPQMAGPCKAGIHWHIQGVQREHAHPMGLRQKQSNQPVFFLIFTKFHHSAPSSTQVAWNPAYASGMHHFSEAHRSEMLIDYERKQNCPLGLKKEKK